jgi:dipeptidyl-peptidase-4
MKSIKNLILFIGILFWFSHTIAQNNKDSKGAENGKITLEDIWSSGKFNPKGVKNFIAMKDGKTFVKLEQNEIVSYDLKSGKKIKTIISKDELKTGDRNIGVSHFEFSQDENKVLIFAEIRSIYRHSYEAQNYVYDIKLKKLTPVFGGTYIRHAQLSPFGDKVAAVQNNNIIISNLEDDYVWVIGGDGIPNEVINGAVDWVYEEEFSMSRGFEWSPDGKNIAYYKFIESHVPEFTLDMYLGNSYPNKETYRYPKAGEPNSKVSVRIFNLENARDRVLETTEDDDSYLPRIQWASSNIVCIQKLNRHQNHWQVISHNVQSETRSILLEEKNKFYIDINPKFHFDEKAENFLFLTERNGFNQIMNFNIQNAKLTPITEANYDVDKVVYYDTKNKSIYYTSAEVSPTERHLYKIEIPSKKKIKLTQESGWHSPSFTQGGLFYLNVFSNFTSAPTYTLHDNNGKIIRVLEDNKELSATLESINLGKTEFGKLETADGVKLNYWQILPPDFNENKKYPVLFFVYGGPGSQTVKNAWGGANYFWHQMLAQQGYIVMSVDNRGTGFRGEEFKKATYLNLGKLEIQDQIASAKWMAQKPFVDKNRIGIWGWSYGGFMSSLGITVGADIFKTAIAVAPVTHWKYYDNIYTERYMRTPNENKEGYDNNAPLSHIDNIKGNYLLIHGTADDNVHPQHAFEMIKGMIQKNKVFDSEFYPNKNHGISGGLSRLHLYNKMTNFILEKL